MFVGSYNTLNVLFLEVYNAIMTDRRGGGIQKLVLNLEA